MLRQACFGVFQISLLGLLLARTDAAVPPNPRIQQLISEISADRIAATQQKLESFETRNIYSPTTDPSHGIGAAREWIASQFRSFSPKLQVTFEKHKLKGDPAKRLYKDVEIWNVVAVLPGTSEPDRQVLVTAHYDTINLVYKTGPDGKRALDNDATATAVAPGVTDDGSGTAAVLELARVLSQSEFRKTIVFIAFASEEYGLEGSSVYAQEAAAKHAVIEGVFNNDIIGSDIKGNGQSGNTYVNVYSAGPEDSSSRSLARYLKQADVLYQPGFRVNMVFRHDRFGRGGDHSPFAALGFPAVRITTPMENFSHQHTASDTFANTAPAYTALITKANAAAICELALAPKPPEVPNLAPTAGRSFATPLTRGSGYDAVMVWEDSQPESDLAGFAVVMRQSSAADWEHEIFVGNVKTFTLPNVNIDEVVLGVKAIDKSGDESTVTPYVSAPYRQQKVETY